MRNGKKILGIIGFGGMGSWHHELVRDRFTDLAVGGTFDIRPERQAYAASLGLHAYASREAMLADPDVDIVLVATPNDLHGEIAIAAMRAGKAVVSEKPVCLSSGELQRIFDVSEETGRLFTVHQNRRWDQDFRTMEKIRNDGLLGDVFHIESRVYGSRGIPGDWRGRREHGGGMVLDWGVHILDQMLLLVPGKVRRVHGSLSHLTNDEVDDGFRILLSFESGVTAMLEVYTNHFIELPRWYMAGTDGTAVISDWSLNGKVVRVTDRREKDVAPVRTAAGLTKTMAPRNEKTTATEALPVVHTDITDFYRNVMAASDGREAPLVTHPQLMRVMRLMEAVFESARLDQVIDFE